MREFSAATWNTYSGTDPARLQRPLALQRERGVSVFGLQEAGGGDIRQWLEQTNGLACTGPTGVGLRVVWDPEIWPCATPLHPVKLSPDEWTSPGSGEDHTAMAAGAILGDGSGFTVEVWSFKGPPHSQVSRGTAPKRRRRILIDSLRTLADMADDSEADAWLAMCDLNWDPTTGYSNERVANALSVFRVHEPTDATFGRRRAIDLHLTVRRRDGGRLRSTDHWTSPGGGDEHPAHRIHGRTYAIRGR